MKSYELPADVTDPWGQRDGLGLALCHSIVSAAGGISIASEPGKGTQVRLTLVEAARPAQP
jgi:signal transduction histidine kinase